MGAGVSLSLVFQRSGHTSVTTLSAALHSVSSFGLNLGPCFEGSGLSESWMQHGQGLGSGLTRGQALNKCKMNRVSFENL